jgi:hypothetical protein
MCNCRWNKKRDGRMGCQHNISKKYQMASNLCKLVTPFQK